MTLTVQTPMPSYMDTLKSINGYRPLGSSLVLDIDGNAGDEAGSAVSLSTDGSRVAIGAAQVGSSGKGKVRVYRYVIPLESTTIQPQVSGPAWR